MKIKDLIAELAKQDPEADVVAAVGWAADTAISDLADCLQVNVDGAGLVEVCGWLSNCGTELVIEPEEDSG